MLYLLFINPRVLIVNITGLIHSWLVSCGASMEFNAVGGGRDYGMAVDIGLARELLVKWLARLVILL